MPWNNPNETIIGGSGEVYIAATGTTLPTSATSSLAAATWTGLGYHTEDGVSINQSVEIQRFGAWQTKFDIRRERGNETFQVTFNLLQWDENTVPLAFGGGSITDQGGGSYKFTPPAATSAIAEKALVADITDGSNRLRIVVPRGTVVDAIQSQFTRSAMGSLPITFEAQEPDDGSPAWFFMSNLAGFATGS